LFKKTCKSTDIKSYSHDKLQYDQNDYHFYFVILVNSFSISIRIPSQCRIVRSSHIAHKKESDHRYDPLQWFPQQQCFLTKCCRTESLIHLHTSIHRKHDDSIYKCPGPMGALLQMTVAAAGLDTDE
jgi:hypothetical protein